MNFRNKKLKKAFVVIFALVVIAIALSEAFMPDEVNEAKRKAELQNAKAEHHKELLDARNSDTLGYGLAFKTDTELGSPFRVYPIGGGDFFARLIEYPFGSSPRVDVQDSVPRGIILYVHGYNDYFFQKELAEKADSAGYAFWAVDLHHFGRSVKPGESRGDFRSISEFYGDLTSALVTAYRIVQVNAQRTQKLDSNIPVPVPVVMIAHSLGGLITSLFVEDNDAVKIDAVVLNSPFLEMNFGPLVRHTAVPLLSFLGKYFPDYPIPGTGNRNYAYSLLKNDKGEWEYNTELKSYDRPQQYFGWVRAVNEGQNRVKAGLHIKAPILVMHGDCSTKEKEWVDEYTHCDGVLNVDHIEEYAPNLGSNVTTKTIEGGLHDLYLSKKPARDEAYKATFEFIDQALQGKSTK